MIESTIILLALIKSVHSFLQEVLSRSQMLKSSKFSVNHLHLLKNHPSIFNRCGRIRPISTTPSDLPDQADVVVIGGGSIGTSTLYHLSKLGVNAILLEKDQLTAGTTWHSAGILWRLRSNDTDIRLTQHTHDLTKSLENETGISTGWCENGAIFVADNKERLSEYQRLVSLSKVHGIDSSVLSPQETKRLHPLMNVSDLYGSVYSPADGTMDPSGWVSALSKGARMNGAKIYENCDVIDIATESYSFGFIKNKKVTGVQIASGHFIKTNTVINCGGAWAPSIGDMVSVSVPLCAMHHAYVVTERIEGIEGMPNVRDSDASIYIKTQGDVLQFGGYENNPIFWDTVDKDFAFSLFDLDWDVFTSHMQGAMKRIPKIENSGIRSTVCGPESFTPDHKPLLGPSPGVEGFFLGCGFNSAGIMFGGGCGNELAKWAVNGQPDIDMFSYDINRFYPKQCTNKAWIRETSHEAYAKNHAIVFPHDEPMAGRNMRKDPFHEAMKASGCVFQMRHGWERPGYFINDADKAEVKPYDYYGNYGHESNKNYGYYDLIERDNTFGWPASHEIVGKEVEACRQSVAVFNQSYFGKFYLSGPDADKAMNWVCTNDVMKPVGSTIYTNMCNPNGGVECDLTVSRIENDENDRSQYYITAGGGSATHDWEWIMKQIKEKGFDCTMRDETEDHGVLSVQGPNSRELLQSLSSADLSDEAFPFSTNRRIIIAGKSVRALRLTFVGELGWELHIPKESCMDVYNAIIESGKRYEIVNAGYHAIDSMSVEKGYKHWHEDLRAEDTPLEAGIGFVCKLKTDIPFCGREALEKQKAEGMKKRLACFSMDDHVPLHGGEVIYRNGECVGFVVRTAYGHTVGKSIAYGYIHHPNDEPVKLKFLKEGSYEIECLREERLPATYHNKAVFDPKGFRVKGKYNDQEKAEIA